MIDPHEIVRGMVLSLSPEILEAEGGTYTCRPSFRVEGDHFFLCLDPVAGKWVPLYTQPGKDRVRLSAYGRTGHPKWTASTAHYHPGQVWTAPAEAVVAAAVAARDNSTRSRRNLLAEKFVPVLE